MTRAIRRDPICRRRRFQPEIIELCVRWYITYRLSYRDLVAMMAERGINVSHMTILRWVLRYVPEFEKRWARYARRVNASWRIDETSISVRGRWHYLYRAVDKHGKSVDHLLRADRGIDAAQAFFRKADATHLPDWPRRVNLDGNTASHRALLALAALIMLLPRRIPMQKGSIVREFSTLRDARVLLALFTSVLSSASLFCVFTYITPTLIDVSGFSEGAVAPILLLFGVGLTVGSTLGGWLGDGQLVPSLLGLLAADALVLVIIHFVAEVPVAMMGMLFVWGAFAFALVPLLQTLIVHHAQAAPNLASTLNQGAFNLGNAAGAWVGSLLLTSGLALRDLSWASAALAVAALLLASAAIGLRRVRRAGAMRRWPE